MVRLLWVCVGGALGSGARYLVSLWMLSVFGPGFPYWTLAVNLTGSFLLTALMEVCAVSEAISPTLRLALGTGVLGGFTTYSTFSYETFRFLQDGAWPLAAANVGITVAGCLAGCALGLAAGRTLVGV